MKLSVIISNRNDVSMLSVTVRSCLEELKPLGKGNAEIVICDNSDLKTFMALESVIPSGYMAEGTIRVFRQSFPCLFTAREVAAKESKGEYIACVDSHMIIGRDMFADLVTFMDIHKHDSTLGFAHAPINWSHQHERNSCHDRDMSINEFGNWGKQYYEARTITWKGMPWICRRNWFLNELNAYGALSQHRLSWGGGDMHIGIKPWLLGYKNWAVPTSPGIHIGPFPKLDLIPGCSDIAKTNPASLDRYRLYTSSGNGPNALGFLVSSYVLGGEAMMKRNEAALTERFGRFINVKDQWATAIDYGKDEKAWLNERKQYTFEQLLATTPWDN